MTEALYEQLRSTDGGQQWLINHCWSDPDQSAAGPGQVALWNPDYACFDVLEPLPGETTRTGKQKFRRLSSYVYRGKRRVAYPEEGYRETRETIVVAAEETP
ncbi:MAG TPA: hypothetical protein VGC92_01410 [Phenylobacterium sp.]